MDGCGGRLYSVLFRRKVVDRTDETKLARCLSTLDLTALGIGSTLGIGIYVIAGQVAHELAGPSVVVSFFIAATASLFAGLCYAEFGARVPKTGSAYVYSYVTVGEFLAYIIGWNLILEYVIGTASVARGWTAYLDSLLDYKLKAFWSEHLPMNVKFLGPYPDFCALALVLVLTVILAIGVKESSLVNNVFTFVNLFVVTYVIICGCFKIEFHNWNIPISQVPTITNGTTIGSGGFFPYGFSGTLAGAATCFYAFVGFDCIATTGEEVRNPQRAIPISIILCLLVCFLAYFGISAVLTLMVPYYELDVNAPLTITFGQVGYTVAKYVIAVGALAGLSASLLGAMFPMPRIVYAMAEDKLIFHFLSHVSDRFKTPLIATAVSGVMAGGMALVFDLTSLVEMMSIGTLLAYTLVAACILILRYDISYDYQPRFRPDYGTIQEVVVSTYSLVRDIFCPSKSHPDAKSAAIVRAIVLLITLSISILNTCLIFFIDAISRVELWAIAVTAAPALCLFILMVILFIQPQNTDSLSFKVPFVPVIPVLSIFVNIYLMLKLQYETWIRFGVWMAIGLTIYFLYGIWFSKERTRSAEERQALLENHAQDADQDVMNTSTNNALFDDIEDANRIQSSLLC